MGYYPACPIDIIINHTIAYNLTSEFGAGYFRSITINPGGKLVFPSDFKLTTGGSSLSSPDNILKILVSFTIIT